MAEERTRTMKHFPRERNGELGRMVVGFTGTHVGMSLLQKKQLVAVLREVSGTEFHHGDCVGADYEAAKLAITLGYRIVVHPPSDGKARAFFKGGKVLKPLPYLLRNRKIVEACSVLIATPQSTVERLRSGTWATVRYGRKCKRKVILIFPDGTQRGGING